MSSEAATIWKHGRIYVVGNALGRIAGLLLIPVYAKFLTPNQFGIYALISVATELLGAMVIQGSGSALARVYIEQSDQHERNIVISSAIIMLCCLAAGLIALSYPLGLVISLIMIGDTGWTGTIVLAVIGMAGATLFTVAVNYYLVTKCSTTFVVVSLAKSLLLLGFNALFVIVFALGPAGVFLGTALALWLVSATVTVLILRTTGLGFSSRYMREMVSIGLPFLPATVFDSVAQGASRYLLNTFVSTADVGIFALALRLKQLPDLVISGPFAQIWVVRRIEAYQDDAGYRELSTIFFYFTVMLVVAGLGLSLLSPEIIRIIAKPEYLPAAACMPYLVASFIFCAMLLDRETAIVQAKRTGIMPWISAASLVVTVGSSLLLIPFMGLIGASLAVMVTQFLRLVMTEWAAQRVCPGQLAALKVRRTVALFALAAAVQWLSWELFGDAVDPLFIVAKLLLLCGFVVVLLLSPIIGADGQAWLYSIVLLYRRRRPVAIAKADEASPGD